jgi:hypothetical protein
VLLRKPATHSADIQQRVGQLLANEAAVVQQLLKVLHTFLWATAHKKVPCLVEKQNGILELCLVLGAAEESQPAQHKRCDGIFTCPTLGPYLEATATRRPASG